MLRSSGVMEKNMLTRKMADVASGLRAVRDKVAAASSRRHPELAYFKPRLVAVSKTKPAALVIEAYEAGQRHFGENYVNELLEKGHNPDILSKCKDIRWHFIGHLQSNKINKVLAVPNLYIIETVHSKQLATGLNNAWPKFRKTEESLLKVMVQINTSGEEEKNGCQPSEASNLVKHVIENCKNLKFTGIMTIGKYGYDPSAGPNPDFLKLRELHNKICQELNLDSRAVELSMGMSSDYEHAIELGSTNIRIGSSIFGYRAKKGE
ncbi:pyridoxal phosphate homeostasis protein [Neodiprion lecontei]|uniref:Pyridoxal phosphate homeostasis protein n=1 Tax=Neodiprion lecontei TaxID=441921 RepID=A0A6J0C9F9_NEOLC|nr:pyridoxal phosphate homeostasis protein [Neodiprion lecontei]